MSILEQINNAKTEEELFQLVEEHVLDIETPLSWKSYKKGAAGFILLRPALPTHDGGGLSFVGKFLY